MRLFAEGKMDEVRTKLHHDMMHFVDEVSEEMLLLIIDKMCACAVRAEKAGVDVIQIPRRPSRRSAVQYENEPPYR